MENSSYLVQRLQKPSLWDEGQRVDLENMLKEKRTLTELYKGWSSLLKPLFQFDYMGSAEFEFGALPNFFKNLHVDASKFALYEKEVEFSYREFSSLFPGVVYTGKKIVYAITRPEWQQETYRRISIFANDQHPERIRTKECVWLADAMSSDKVLEAHAKLKTKSRPLCVHDKYIGWIELDNGFMFFLDKDVAVKFSAIFGIKSNHAMEVQ